MELNEAIEILEKHNYWRRDNSVPSKTEMISPKELGIAIDKIVEHFKNNVLLHNVSNRRELLIAYDEYCMGKENIEVVRYEYLKKIDEFLSNL